MIDDVAGLVIGRPVEKAELLSTLKLFTKDKSPGPDGWTVEFFLHFFPLIGKEVTASVEDSRLKSCVPASLNATYLTLIPKVDKPVVFGDFCPISLCNLMYKVISKIIAERLKPYLAMGISDEQFGFLKNRQLLDSVGLAHEGVHSIHLKHSPSLILKVDLVKAYDRLDWTFLRFILIQIGTPLHLVNWIMSCVTSSNYSVLVNGSPSATFDGDRGLRQGFPLSPYILILAMEGLSLLIYEAKRKGLIKGVKVAPALYLTHLLFIDDVLLFGTSCLGNGNTFGISPYVFVMLLV